MLTFDTTNNGLRVTSHRSSDSERVVTAIVAVAQIQKCGGSGSSLDGGAGSDREIE